jgi:hypothetical protein
VRATLASALSLQIKGDQICAVLDQNGSNRPMLEMHIVRAPLPHNEYETILTEYNRLTLAQIPMDEFLRWVLKSPGGPAWHALLKTEEGRVVGHTSVLPISAQRGDARLVTAMSEYSFVHEDFRKQKIHGFDTTSRPTFIILLDQLFQHCLKQGWGPLFASTNEKNQIFTRKVGLRALNFPLKECLLVLRPFSAARYTPNLSTKQRSALYAAGVVQSGVWTLARPFRGRTNGVHGVPLERQMTPREGQQLSFYEEAESLKWRYLHDQYVRYAVGADGDYVIVKRGREDRYLRICQYRLGSADSVQSLIRPLMDQARKDRAMGIRWAVYNDGAISEAIVRELQRFAFLCADRVRIVMVHKDFPEYLEPAKWCMSDAHFCFDP